jgi:hypothetical protein
MWGHNYERFLKRAKNPSNEAFEDPNTYAYRQVHIAHKGILSRTEEVHFLERELRDLRRRHRAEIEELEDRIADRKAEVDGLWIGSGLIMAARDQVVQNKLAEEKRRE